MATEEVLELGNEGNHGLELRMRRPRNRLVDLVLRPQEADQSAVDEYPVVDDDGALRYVGAIGSDARRRGYVAPPGLQGDSVPVRIDRAGDDGLVPGAAPRLLAALEPEAYAIVERDKGFVYPAFARQHRAFLHFERRRVHLHPPYVRRPRRYSDGIHDGPELHVVEHEVRHPPEPFPRQFHRRHDRRSRRGERPPASPAEEAARSVGLDAARSASRANSLSMHEKTPSGAKAATGGRSTAR